MVAVAWFVLFFACAQCFVALSNFLFSPVLKQRNCEKKPLVSVLIPARNEENNIGNLLSDLSQESYENIEILIFNDQSEDKTAEIAEKYKKQNPKIQIFHSRGLPQGWLGKNYACHELANRAQGSYFLFLDADVRISDGLIQSAVCHAEKHRLALLSVFPKQIMQTPAEKTVVPVMNFILLSFLPLRLVRTSGYAALSAANGQFMFFNATVYRVSHWHKQMRDNKVEDIAIARKMKSLLYRTDCLTGNRLICCRMYTRYEEAIQGFTKNVAAFFGGSYALALSYWLLALSGIFLVLYFLPRQALFLYVAAIFFRTIFVSVSSRQNIFNNFLYHYQRLFSFGLIVLQAIKNKLKKQSVWKGRNIDL